MNIWKISFSKDSAKKDTVENLHFCLSHGIIAVTFSEDEHSRQGAPYWEDLSLFEEYKDYPSEIYALFSQIRGQDLVWTRDHLGVYFLGRVLETSPYRFKKGGDVPDKLQYPCRWFRIGTIDSISQMVVDAFSPYRKLRNISGQDANLYSRLVYNEQVDDFAYPIPEMAEGSLFDRFDTDDFTDIVALYLQQLHGCRVVPSSFDRETGIFDFTISIGSNGRSGAVKVHLETSTIETEDFNSFSGQIYIFAPFAQVNGIVPGNMHIVTLEEIQEYLFRNMLSLPFRIGNWVRYYLQNVGFGDLE